jgi:antitoxin (DNA-binding transcriptional repressor) of toxin-antitoxin stability system
MKTIAIGNFKATCLKVLGNLNTDHEPLIITKHKKPIAKIVAIDDDVTKNKWQSLEGTVLYEEDIVSPLGDEDWNACK